MIGLRSTRQKQCILGILKNAKGPLGIHEIWKLGIEQLPGLGIATVYRTIAGLQEQGELKTLAMHDGESRFETIPQGHAHHHHFLCRKCSRAFDLQKCPISGGLGRFAPKGFRVETHELTLHGLCANCSVPSHRSKGRLL